ncbi:YqjF family protein [Alteribacter natronophilus]|uniref:YqjF family protein n=1 Tax=Alteribacter natronophilus TaxID=2583810 RepID=UPI00110E9FBE|nr:DUF2071 domain-containing protein [Alteribacter natronophilus]TMW72055.1 DUF2071 domain-containing protein [Alteribacter natronophilus]
MTQNWTDLMFAHWRVSAAELEKHLPDELELDTWNGEAWVGVVPFRMSGTRARFLPPVPFLSTLLELNLRTYVKYRGMPGVYFISLDADSRPAVEGARSLFHLPYFKARMSAQREDEWVHFESNRTDRRGKPAFLRASYRAIPGADSFEPEEGTFVYWLTERYRLFTRRKESLLAGEIDHAAWRLTEAEASFTANTLGDAHSITLPAEKPVLHKAYPQKVRFWPFRKLY